MRILPALSHTRRSKGLAALAAVGACVALLAGATGWSGWHKPASAALVLALVLAMLVGEWYQVSAQAFRATAPIATASAFGFAFADRMPDGDPLGYGGSFVVVITGACMVIIAVARQLVGRAANVTHLLGRFAGIAVAAWIFRVHHPGPVGHGAPPDLSPWQLALLLLAISVAGLSVDILVTTTIKAVAGSSSWVQTFRDELRSSFALSAALAVTGVLIALAVPALGAAAVPLFLAPLVLTLFAFRRYVSIRATYLQSIRTLSRLTDAAGYTPSGHSERVAALATAVGRELGLPERELLDLEYAALLHDIGQVALVDPIPGGATVLAAPADQRRIAADTVAIVRETGVLEAAARILEHQTTPYRQLREFGEDIPLTSRIVKVVNAFEDLTAGSRSQRARSAAVERIYLGLGYEYDPHVVDALMRVLSGPRSGS